MKTCRNYVEAGTKGPKRPKLSNRAKMSHFEKEYLNSDWTSGDNIWMTDVQ